MLNISEKTIFDKIDTSRFRSFQRTDLSHAHRSFKRWLLSILVLFIALLFLPWTQNIQTNGTVTTLLPDQRPQTIHATIGGRVEQWFVREGQLVKAGDTIVFLSETKTEYFDTNLVARTGSQVAALGGALGTYAGKVAALDDQIAAMQQERKFKNEQLLNKQRQAALKVTSDSVEAVRAKLDLEIAQNQFERAKEMLAKGLIPLTSFEQRNLKLQETAAKNLAASNKWLISRNELDNARLELSTVLNEYANKLAKAESDKFSTLGDRFEAENKLNKLQVEQENYRRRRTFYHITAPQDCYITQALVAGVGETVKEGAPVVAIMPAGAKLAVEMFVKPIDLPLVSVGSRVNFIFDGWPAFVFSGWQSLTFGTYEGTVFAMDNTIGPNGTYRILVAPLEDEKPWPAALRPGGGAQCVALLHDVPLWYELWRKLNGFPPDFYKKGATPAEKGLKPKN